MNDRKCFETLDRTLRDVLNAADTIFGGKSIILGGDFRQTLPVKKGASKIEIINSSIAKSDLWPHFQVINLTENMRLLQPHLNDEEKTLIKTFSSWILNIGDGNLGKPDASDPDNASWIQIPHTYCIPDNINGMTNLINFIYDEQTLRNPTADILQQKVIVCPKNETADIINLQILSMVHGDITTYISSDTATPFGNDGGETELLYPVEYLNSLNLPGLPMHRLELKIGVPVMLLRNLNLMGGLCNGTRMIIAQLLTRVIEVQIITGTRIGERVFIPKISLIHKDSKLPFILKRKQFPIRPCFAMTINKSQCQSLNKIGIYLPDSVFGHGQLYVALSRATSPHGLKLLIKQQELQPENTTKNIVYKDFLENIKKQPVH